MKRVIYLLFFISVINYSNAQNAIGLTVGYGHFKPKQWNAFLDKYNSSDTVISKQPYFKSYPMFSLFYERKLTEYFYLQGCLSYFQSRSSSKQNGNLDWEILFPSIGLNINWYPFKMIKGMSRTPWNPLVFQINIAGNYLQKSFLLNNKPVIEQSPSGFSTKNLAFFFGAGIGYDLNFGKHWVVQTVFNFNYCYAIEMPELTYLVPSPEKHGLSTQTEAFSTAAKIGLLYLFK